MVDATDTVALYQKYGPALVRKAERILLNADDAQDVVHGLFVDLMQRPSKHMDLPYLYRAVTNRSLNVIRDRKTRARLLERQQEALRGPVRSRLDEHVVDLDLLARLTETLDARTLEVVVCLFVDDMSQEEAAEVLGVSRKTVGKRLKKARQKLQRIAANGGRGGDGRDRDDEEVPRA